MEDHQYTFFDFNEHHRIRTGHGHNLPNRKGEKVPNAYSENMEGGSKHFTKGECLVVVARILEGSSEAQDK